jgi:hypothetical protein
VESLLKGKKGHYGSPPCVNKFRSAGFRTEAIFLYKTTYHNEEVNCTEPSR